MWLQLMWLQFEAVRCPVGVELGLVCVPLGSKPVPNGPQTTPTGPRTTSNCSRMSCSHIHRSPLKFFENVARHGAFFTLVEVGASQHEIVSRMVPIGVLTWEECLCVQSEICHVGGLHGHEGREDLSKTWGALLPKQLCKGLRGPPGRPDPHHRLQPHAPN